MDSLIRDLLRGAKQLRMQLEAAMVEGGGSFAMFVVLDAVALEPGLSQRAIASRLSIEGPSITRHLDHLEREGLVTRQRDIADRRIMHITLTDDGRARYIALCPIIQSYEARLFTTYTPEDRLVLERFLQQIRHLSQEMEDNER